MKLFMDGGAASLFVQSTNSRLILVKKLS